jgi:hypothetical protein
MTAERVYRFFPAAVVPFAPIPSIARRNLAQVLAKLTARVKSPGRLKPAPPGAAKLLIRRRGAGAFACEPGVTSTDHLGFSRKRANKLIETGWLP